MAARMIYSNSQSSTEIRRSLHRIVDTILATPSFWPRTELATQLRQEIEKLLERIDSMESQLAHDYAYALSTLVRHMPDEIEKIYRGSLTELLLAGSRPNLIRT